MWNECTQILVCVELSGGWFQITALEFHWESGDLREREDHVKRLDRVAVLHLLILTRSNLHRPYHSSSGLDFCFEVVTLYERDFYFPVKY